MKLILKTAIVCAALAATGALGAQKAPVCGEGSDARGMRARLEAIQLETDKIEWTADRAERRQLMELQMKHVREGLRELRGRDLPLACRVEMMNSMMEQMVRHEQATHELAGH